MLKLLLSLDVYTSHYCCLEKVEIVDIIITSESRQED
jgi:hypothetical protein